MKGFTIITITVLILSFLFVYFLHNPTKSNNKTLIEHKYNLVIDLPEEFEMRDSKDKFKCYISNDTIHILFDNPRNNKP